ncbi:MAG: hypothetical protein AB7I19_14270 [Planctomycetota bacterium]
MPLIGQSVVGDDQLPSATYYSPWFSRAADAATFFLQLMHVSTNGQVLVTIEHKNIADADSSASTAGTFSLASSVGTIAKAVSGLKELVRIKYAVAASSGSAWLHLRMLPPMWQPN